MTRIILLLSALFSCIILPGQSLLKDVSPGIMYSDPLFMGQANQKLFFATAHQIHTSYWPSGIWSTDGTEAGTVGLLSMPYHTKWDFSYYGNTYPALNIFPVLNNKLIFTGMTSQTNWNLYSSDGTKQGTQKFMDFGDSVFLVSFMQHNFTSSSNSFLFATTNYNGNVYIWRSDGTTAGTRIIMKNFSYLYWGLYTGMPVGFTYLNNAAYFTSLSDTNTITLWKVDASVNGAQAVISFPRLSFEIGYNLQVFKNKLYFGIPIPYGYGTAEAWTSDGTTVGTKPLQDTPGGPLLNHFGSLTECGSKAFFISTDPQSGNELWITDGTVAGTRIVKDVYPGVNHGVASIIGKTSSKLFFIARDTTTSVYNVWVTDGNQQGTMRLPKTYLPTIEGFERYPYALISTITINDNLYFQNFTDKLVKESELWVTDGTPLGTRAIIDDDSLYITSSLFFPRPLVYYKNKLYFSASTKQTGSEPHYLDSCLCVPDKDQTISGRLYPNPSSGKVIIDIDWKELSLYKTANLLVFDALGRKVLSKTFSLNETCGQLSFETSHLSQGVYFANVLIGNKKFTKRFVVLR